MQDEIMGCIYLVTNKVNKKQYVGKTKYKLICRIRVHKYCASKKSGQLFHRALRKYGFDAFEWKVLFEGDDENKLNRWERWYIKKLETKSPNGYNLTDGGEGLLNPTNETRNKIRLAALKRPPMSEETKRKIAINNVGKHPSTPNMKKKKPSGFGMERSIYNKLHGIHPSIEACKKGGLSLKGKKRSPELIAKKSRALKGRIISLEHRRKISATLTGRKIGPFTEEHKRKISIALKGKAKTKEHCKHISESKRRNLVKIHA